MAAHNPHPILAFLFIFNILLAIAGHAVGGRDIPTNSDNLDKNQPELFLHHGGSVLIPGFGRFKHPKFGKGSNPFTHNPVTGSSGGSGIGSIGGGSVGSGGGASHEYVPGGDDTFFPNPGVEVPNPGSGGNVPPVGRP